MGQGWETKPQMVRPRPGKAGVRNLRAQMPAYAFSKGFCSAPFPLYPRAFCIALTFCPYSPTPGPFVCLQTRLTKSVYPGWGIGSGLTGFTVNDEILKGLVSRCK